MSVSFPPLLNLTVWQNKSEISYLDLSLFDTANMDFGLYVTHFWSFMICSVTSTVLSAICASVGDVTVASRPNTIGDI